MWGQFINMKYDENGKPITIFDENPELLNENLSIVQEVSFETDTA